MSTEAIDNATSVDVDLPKLTATLVSTKSLLNLSRAIAVRLVENEEMAGLNERFRGIRESTDVLTFPSGLDDPLPIGDIAICVPYAGLQAGLRGVPLENELAALLIHGCLHLVGFDDIVEEDRRAMQAKMNEIGDKLGIPIDAEWTSVLHQAQEP